MKDIEKIDTDWNSIIKNFPQLISLKKNYLQKTNQSTPIYPLTDVFKSFSFFDSVRTKVVILGQDPYHKEGQATGLSFACTQEKCPPSLRNIKKLLKKDVNIDLVNRDLEHWAKQGILLLNASLCVQEKKPGSCMKMWEPFTKYIIKYINENCDNVIFVAWGAFAHKLLQNINTKKHYLIISSHPSPLSANRSYKEYPSFMNSTPFSYINKHYPEIKW
jgi:uracil-DNA glycosylase